MVGHADEAGALIRQGALRAAQNTLSFKAGASAANHQFTQDLS